MLLEKYSEFWILKSVLLHTINWFINRQKEKKYDEGKRNTQKSEQAVFGGKHC